MPTNRDQVAFREAMADGVAVVAGHHRIHEAYRFFRESIHDWVTDGADHATIEGMVPTFSR